MRTFFSRVKTVPHERLVELATARDEETHRIAYRQAEREFEASQRQVTALEEEVVKALTGESQLDLTVANSMLLKHREKLQTARHAMEEAKARLEKEKSSAQQTKDQIDEMVSWADCYAKADIGTRHMIIARLIERVDVATGHKVHIKFRVSLKQFLGQE